MVGELAVGAVQQRVVQVGFDDAGLQIVEDGPAWDPAIEFERRDVGVCDRMFLARLIVGKLPLSAGSFFQFHHDRLVV